MKQSFLNSIKISALALIIGLGVSAVSAWTAPTVNPPATGTVKSPSGDTAKPVAAAINLSIFDQIKRGGITVNTQKPPATADGKLVSPLSFFKKVLLPNVDTSVYIGGASFADPSFASSFPGNRDVPMTINLTGRLPVERINDAILFKTDVACAQPTKIINSSASAFEFWNTAKGENADLLANGIRLDGGNPAAGKILISVDGDGRAVWATPKLAANGKDIIFDTYSDSPVGICGTPINPTVDACDNMPGAQPTVPSGYHLEPAGSKTCIVDTITCRAGQQVENGQCVCSSGIREGQIPNTNIQTTGKIITYENGVNQNPGGGAPLVPYYVVLDELRHNGGPGDACKIIPLNTSCPSFDFDTLEDDLGNPVRVFTDANGVTHDLGVGGNSWEIDHRLGDQCIAGRLMQIGGTTPYIMMNIER